MKTFRLLRYIGIVVALLFFSAGCGKHEFTDPEGSVKITYRDASQFNMESQSDQQIETFSSGKKTYTKYTPTFGNETKRIALVVGNNAYKTAPLKNPGSDASAIASALKRVGFSVIEQHNVSLREMEHAIDLFHGRLEKGSIGLFYYAGHGIQVDGTNYLIPIDAKIKSESDIKYESVDAGRVLGKMEDAANGMNIVILDACRNNPFSRSFRSGNRGLARMDAPTGSILAYSTAPGDVAADGHGNNSVYTKHLLRYLETPGLDINNIFIRTRMDVINETRGEQVPWEASSLTGLFYFVESKNIH
jgi:uncharacterized caspase-like protein